MKNLIQGLKGKSQAPICHSLFSFCLLSDRGTFVRPVQTPAGSKDRDAVIKEYLDETGVIDVIETWMKHFADKAELQYNPYPGLVWEARQYTER